MKCTRKTRISLPLQQSQPNPRFSTSTEITAQTIDFLHNSTSGGSLVRIKPTPWPWRHIPFLLLHLPQHPSDLSDHPWSSETIFNLVRADYSMRSRDRVEPTCKPDVLPERSGAHLPRWTCLLFILSALDDWRSHRWLFFHRYQSVTILRETICRFLTSRYRLGVPQFPG